MPKTLYKTRSSLPRRTRLNLEIKHSDQPGLW